MLGRAPSMRGPCLSGSPEQKRANGGGDKPEQHVGQQHPDAVFHARDALVALGVFFDVHVAEDTESNEIANEDDDVDDEKEPWLRQRQHEDERDDGAQRPAYNCPHPLAVDVLVLLARVVQVNCVDANDRQAHDKLEEAEDEPRNRRRG